MAAGKWTPNWKMLKNSMLRDYSVTKAHKNKIPTAIPMLSGLTFPVAIIFTPPGVAVTSEMNIVDKKWKKFQSDRCCSHPSDVEL